MADVVQSPSSWTALLAVTMVIGFALINAKGLPLVYTIRLLPSVYRIIKPRWSRRRGQQQQPPPLREWSSAAAKSPDCVDGVAAAAADASVLPLVGASPALFQHHVSTSRAVLADLDIMAHKSNSTFFTDADVNRTALLSQLLSEGQAAVLRPSPPPSAPFSSSSTDGDGREKLPSSSSSSSSFSPTMFYLAGVQCRFSREIKPFRSYGVSSRILTWSDRAFYVVTYFLRPGARLPADVEVLGGPGAVQREEGLRRLVFATLVTKFVFKAGRETVRPEEVFRSAGLLVAQRPVGRGRGGEGEDENEEEETSSELWGMEKVDRAVESEEA
ncbi:hypothetical protein BX600DRAFT_505484 [Xylariales sp. PMI_506]|nr:hypothetical protein BX600DRAFT_505484 [Xylariales sp. PMI_506]